MTVFTTKENILTKRGGKEEDGGCSEAADRPAGHAGGEGVKKRAEQGAEKALTRVRKSITWNFYTSKCFLNSK